MRFVLAIILVVLSLGLFGCQEKTPEETEAAKYKPLKPLSPEERAALNQRLGGIGHAPPKGIPGR